MLQNIKELYRSKLVATDGDLGHVKDFYFDEKSWVIRYLVADTASWLTGRQVLLSPHALGRFDQDDMTLSVRLTRKQIEDSPPIESHKPVSRQYEAEYYRYYGWPEYWVGGGMWGLGGYPVTRMAPVMATREITPQPVPQADLHLRSTQEIIGYHIQTTDGPIGYVSGFLADDKSWAIHELAVEAGHWYSGKEILISPDKIERISHEESKVFVSLTKADIQRTGEDEIAHTGAENHGAGNFSD